MFKKLPYYTPNYVVDEFIKYIFKVSPTNNAEATYENIFALINLAKVNNRITQEQADIIKEIIEYNKSIIIKSSLTEERKRFDENYQKIIKIVLEKINK